MYKTYPQLKVGDYITFEDNDKILYKVLKIKRIHFLYYDTEINEDCWERQEYITRIYKVSKETK